MLLAREGRSLVSRCECMPDNITSNCEYVAVNLSGDRPTHCLWRVLASCLYHSVPAMFSASYRFTPRIRTCAGAPESSPGCDQIFLTNRTPPEPALQDLACPFGIAGLRGERGSGDVRRHAVAGYRRREMISGSRLRKPDIAGIACKLAALQSADDCIAITGCSGCFPLPCREFRCNKTSRQSRCEYPSPVSS